MLKKRYAQIGKDFFEEYTPENDCDQWVNIYLISLFLILEIPVKANMRNCD